MKACQSISEYLNIFRHFCSNAYASVKMLKTYTYISGVTRVRICHYKQNLFLLLSLVAVKEKHHQATACKQIDEKLTIFSEKTKQNKRILQ